ncbi:hypothetical protein [Pseudoalteromonas distincta]
MRLLVVSLFYEGNSRADIAKRLNTHDVVLINGFLVTENMGFMV